jgi:hypothetical protein
MFRKITVCLIISTLAMTCAIFASEARPENTSGSAIAVPEAPLLSEEVLPPEIEEPGEAMVWEDPELVPETPEDATPAEEDPTDEMSTQEDILDVLLPDALPFDVVIFSGTGKGVIASPEFRIENRNSFPVRIALCDARVDTTDKDVFRVRPDENLPEEGNNLCIRMICDDGTSSASAVFGTDPGGTDFVYALEGGASGSLRFEGAVNEYGDAAWGDTAVRVSLRFEITSAAPPEEIADDTAEAEPNGSF